MTCLNPTPPASGPGAAVQALRQALPTQALLEFERTFIGALSNLGREMVGLGLGMAAQPAAGGPDAAEIEYASWMPEPGAIEVDSWVASLRATPREMPSQPAGQPESIQELRLPCLQPGRSDGDLPNPWRESR